MGTHNTARDFFLHLLSTVLLYMGVVSLITLIFSIVNHYVPDVLQQNIYERPIDAMRMPTAMLIIVYPVYAWSLYYISKLIARDQEIKEFKIRKWLMSLTIFIAALIVIVTLVNVVFNFLEGEFTLRFLFKVLAVLLIAAAMFYYYLLDVKDDKNKVKTQKIMSWGVTVFVLATIVTSFVAMGLPVDRRAEKIDERRVEHLSALYWEISNYYNEHKKLPSTLTDMPIAVNPEYLDLKDPQTGEPYQYILQPEKGDKNFQLCATFITEFVDESGYYGFKPEVAGIRDRSHPVGYHCYDLNVVVVDDKGVVEPQVMR